MAQQLGLLSVPQVQGGLLNERQARLDALLQGLGALGPQLIAAGAPSTQPGNFGRGIANAGQAFMQGYQNSLNGSQDMALRNQQMLAQKQQMLAQKQAMQQAQQAQLAKDRYINAAIMPNGPTNAAAQAQQSPMGLLAQADPEGFIKASMQNAMTPKKSLTASDLVQVAGPNGPQYLPASNAVGQAPYQKPIEAKTPSFKGVWDNQLKKASYASDAQIAASPARYSPIPNGLKMTSDGKGGLTLVSGTMAAGQGGGAGSFGEGMNRSLDEVIKGGLDSLQSLNAMDAAYDPSFSTLVGKVKNFGSAALDRTGLVDITPEDRQQLQKYTEWRANALQMASETLNRLSGAAVSPAEAERIQGFIPGADDSPIEFQTKLKRYKEQIILSVLRAKHFRNTGGYTGEVWNATTLDGMKKIYNDRGDALASAFMKENPNADAKQVSQHVSQRLTMEYGIAM